MEHAALLENTCCPREQEVNKKIAVAAIVAVYVGMLAGMIILSKNQK